MPEHSRRQHGRKNDRIRFQHRPTGGFGAGCTLPDEIPVLVLLLLRHTSETPDYLEMEVEMPDSEPFRYHTKIYKTQLVSEEEIFRRRLLILLPFYLMRYEKELSSLDAESDAAAALIRECREIRMRLADLTLLQGDELLYRQITELIIRVSDHLLAANEPLNRKVRPAMGGEVLELMDDKIERSRKEGIQEGIALGRQEGVALGRQEGVALGRQEGFERAESILAEQMAALGIDRAVIDRMMADAAAKISSQQRPGD